MGITAILLAVIVVLSLIVLHYRKTAGGRGSNDDPSTWAPVKDSWAQLRGKVLNMVIAGEAGGASTAWVTDNAPHGKGGSMAREDANVVCEKACDGWKASPSVAVYCDCSSEKAVDF